MPEGNVAGRRLLIVEDEYMLADEIRSELILAGASEVIMVSTCEEAIELVMNGPPLDGAILDVNLAGEFAFPVADLLLELQIPFLFVTGYDLSAIPAKFQSVMRCEKPVSVSKVVEIIGR